MFGEEIEFEAVVFKRLPIDLFLSPLNMYPKIQFTILSTKFQGAYKNDGFKICWNLIIKKLIYWLKITSNLNWLVWFNIQIFLIILNNQNELYQNENLF